MKDKVVSIRLPSDLDERVQETAQHDYRKKTDQISYLIALGLKARAAMRQSEADIASGRTQVDVEALEANR